MTEPAIRRSQPADLDALYEICLRTGAAGRDATALMDDPRLLGDLFVAPYVVLEPEHAFVVDDGTGTAQGYAVGALDTRAFEARTEADWWPARRAARPGPTGRGVLDDLFIGYLHGVPAAADDVVAGYPSHLHIDLLPPFQSGGWGRRLLDTLVSALARRRLPGRPPRAWPRPTSGPSASTSTSASLSSTPTASPARWGCRCRGRDWPGTRIRRPQPRGDRSRARRAAARRSRGRWRRRP